MGNLSGNSRDLPVQYDLGGDAGTGGQQDAGDFPGHVLFPQYRTGPVLHRQSALGRAGSGMGHGDFPGGVGAVLPAVYGEKV